jgi:four helix bundle protein
MRNFRDYDIWKEGMQISKAVYLLTRDFPDHEKFGIVSQIQRAVISIPSNIAEGASRNSEVDFARYLEIATGSAFEVETQLILANDLGYINSDSTNEILININSLEKKLNTLITKIRNNHRKPKSQQPTANSQQPTANS